MTLGCKVNQYESEAMAELFTNSGYDIVHDEIADIYVINTCTVTNLSDRKSRQFISKAKKENPSSIIAVVGCYSQIAPEDIEKLGDIDVILGTTDRCRIVELCENAYRNHIKINLVKELKPGKEFDDLEISENAERTRSYIKVQEGCNQFCTYCIIPYARGPITSRPMDAVLSEASKLAANGYKEVVLTGIHVASYGLDLKLNDALIELIESVSKIDGIERVRMSSLEPRIVDEELLERLSNIPEFCDHFHLSLQSGSDEILKKMNRKYDSDMYLEKINLIRKYFPNAGITTDIIVGFPGESDDDFNDSLKFVDEIGFSRVHVFRYSPRAGTPAAEYPNQVHGEIKRERSELLIEAAERKSIEFMDSLIGTKLSVLFETGDGKSAEGYSTNYIKVAVKSDLDLESEIKTVIIEGRETDVLVGKLID